MPYVLKCKFCGGDVQVNAELTLGTCQYCGNTVTFPKIRAESRIDLFNRGNYYRQKGEFDKALSVYEDILKEDPNDAEAHWCCALSRFGIEYVEDPVSLEYIPTCHRASFDSFMDDIDYKAAIDNADEVAKRQYYRDGIKIAEVQRGILATSKRENPFDIFICYKETDDAGRRTLDSKIAQEIYYQLVDESYKVFFSRITLEDKIGSEYEPYIFAALNTSQVMIVVGTSRENLESVWVRNEWSRFLSIMRKDRTKVLLPCYKNMDPYDLPDALSVLQAYDINSIGFMQDLLHGIGKIIRKEENKPELTQDVSSASPSGANGFIERGKLAIEDKEWEKADEFFEKALDIDPKNGEIYLGKVLVDERCSSIEEYIEKKSLANTSGEKEKKKITLITKEEIEKLANEYVIERYLPLVKIIGLFKSPLEGIIETESGYWNKRKQEIEKSFGDDKNIAKAYRFGNNKLIEELDQIKTSLIGVIDAKERQCKEQEGKDIQDLILNNRNSVKEKVENLYEEAKRKREKDYRDWIERYENSTSKKELQKILDNFISLQDYEESLRYVELCREKIKETKSTTEKIKSTVDQLKEKAERQHEQAKKKREAELEEAKRQKAKKLDEINRKKEEAIEEANRKKEKRLEEQKRRKERDLAKKEFKLQEKARLKELKQTQQNNTKMQRYIAIIASVLLIAIVIVVFINKENKQTISGTNTTQAESENRVQIAEKNIIAETAGDYQKEETDKTTVQNINNTETKIESTDSTNSGINWISATVEVREDNWNKTKIACIYQYYGNPEDVLTVSIDGMYHSIETFKIQPLQRNKVLHFTYEFEAPSYGRYKLTFYDKNNTIIGTSNSFYIHGNENKNNGELVIAKVEKEVQNHNNIPCTYQYYGQEGKIYTVNVVSESKTIVNTFKIQPPKRLDMLEFKFNCPRNGVFALGFYDDNGNLVGQSNSFVVKTANGTTQKLFTAEVESGKRANVVIKCEYHYSGEAGITYTVNVVDISQRIVNSFKIRPTKTEEKQVFSFKCPENGRFALGFYDDKGNLIGQSSAFTVKK